MVSSLLLSRVWCTLCSFFIIFVQCGVVVVAIIVGGGGGCAAAVGAVADGYDGRWRRRRR